MFYTLHAAVASSFDWMHTNKEKTPRAKVIKIRLHRRGQNIQIDRMIEDVSARSYFSTTIKYHCEEKEKWLSQIQAN